MQIEQDRQLQSRLVTLRKLLTEKYKGNSRASSIYLPSTTYIYTPSRTQALTLTSSTVSPSSILLSNQPRKERRSKPKPYLLATCSLALYYLMQQIKNLQRSARQSSVKTRSQQASKQSRPIRKRQPYTKRRSSVYNIEETAARLQNAPFSLYSALTPKLKRK